MKILLVSPEINFTTFPLGIAYISSSLKRAGFEVHCIDFTYYSPQQYQGLIEAAVAEHDIDVIGTGGYHHSLDRICLIFHAARRVKPNIITVLGGTLYTTLPVPVFEKLGIDYGVTGEGDETIVELISTLKAGGDVSRVPGIYYRDASGAVVPSETRELIADINALPLPDYDGFQLDRFLEVTGKMAVNVITDTAPVLDNPRYTSVLASRSCPFGCTFCYHVMGRSYRRRSLDSLFTEIDHLVARYRVNMINFVDDLFVIKREEALEFCRRIKPYNLIWFVQLRVTGLDLELLGIMREAGCRYISYGIESMSPVVLKSMKKNITPQQINHALALTSQARIGFQGNLIFGDPAETVETVNESLTWWVKNPKYQIWTWLIQTYPGAPIFHKAKQLGVVTDELDYALAGGSGMPFTINITGMDAATHQELQLVIRNLYALPRLPAQLLSITSCGEHALQNSGQAQEPLPVVDIKIRCPECQHEVAYRRISFSGQRRLICRECGSRVDTPLRRFQALLVPAEQRRALHQAQELYQQGKLRESIEILQHDPEALDSADGQALIGTVMLRSGMPDEAYQHLAQASGSDPFTAYLENNYGVALFALGRVGLALMRFRQAKTLQPGHADACINESLVLAHLKYDDSCLPVLVPPQEIKPLDIRRFRISTPDIKSRDAWGQGLVTNIALPEVHPEAARRSPQGTQARAF
jgi:anaerobic magnesium-protoporphyrin IX monomethyl ester cyclase